ncbi:MAG: chromosomal replication initiator protein DnaA [Candidatus Mycalebacterium zealandia]|nr:MAG: chromosomal replication initiator protein DnaA [Candidatus Mycalebacterium zealandia]
MQREDLSQIWQGFLGHVEQGGNVDRDTIEIFSKSQISGFDDKEGVVEILPPDRIGMNCLTNNVGNSLAEISDYFTKFYGVKKVEVANPKGESTEDVLIPPEKNVRKEVLLGHLNSKYSFKSFVVGESNQLAFTAASTAAKQPGRHNPLFIRGSSGLGKTHLMNAVGNEFEKNNPNLKICCMPSEDFTNIVIEHIGGKRMSILKKKLRNECDLLMIDDIQFLEGKEKVLEEFFHTFNTLHEKGKQIIVTSDEEPGNLRFEPRLKTRFMWGLTVDIRHPDIETRAAILKKKAEARKIEIPPGVIEIISEKVKGNVRELEGVLAKLIIMAEIDGRPIDIRTAHQIIDERSINQNGKAEKDISAIGRNMSVELIIESVKDVFNLEKEQLVSLSRERGVVFPRQLAMSLIRKHLGTPYPSIGVFFKRDHSTVIHAVNKIEENIKQGDELTVKAIEEIEDRLGI